jgi:hypothetical protein
VVLLAMTRAAEEGRPHGPEKLGVGRGLSVNTGKLCSNMLLLQRMSQLLAIIPLPPCLSNSLLRDYR